jgi:hypothetical protein
MRAHEVAPGTPQPLGGCLYVRSARTSPSGEASQVAQIRDPPQHLVNSAVSSPLVTICERGSGRDAGVGAVKRAVVQEQPPGGTG